MPVELQTERLKLRQWRESDRAPFAAMSVDPTVMRYFPAPMTRAESDVVVDRCMQVIETNGWGFWAVEVPGVLEFAGFVGLNQPTWEAHFTPCVEVGWRLATSAHGKGYATEAARAAIQFGFETLALDEIVALTIPTNTPSRRVMERLGMVHDKRDDFDHPRVEAGHWAQRHVLYRLKRSVAK